MTQLLEPRSRRQRCGDAVRVRRDLASRRCRHQADAQRAGVGADLVQIRSLGRRRRVRIAGHRAADSVEHAGAVAHRAAQNVLAH
jgi:hypothetical protein